MRRKAMLAGPIEFWWDENWETPQHWLYADWRDALQEALVGAGFVTYRPDMAIKGPWDPAMQAINDRALEVVDAVIVSNFDPPVRCDGTDDEVAYLSEHNCKARLYRVTVPATRSEFAMVLRRFIFVLLTDLV